MAMRNNPARVGTVTKVSSLTTVQTLLPADDSRIGASISNDSTAVLTLRLGDADASQTDYTVKLAAITNGVPGYFELPYDFKGRVSGLWASANGGAVITDYR